MMLVAAASLAGFFAATPRPASAEGLFDLFFGGFQKQQQRAAPPQASFFADPFGQNQQPAPPPATRRLRFRTGFLRARLRRPLFSADARNASPAQICQAFCPASPTKVFFGSNIDGASSAAGERYADSENAYAYRKAMRADCTCNGRDPAGLAPVDLTLDTSLRPGDVIATTDGLVAFSGVKAGDGQTAEFTPVASYPGLTPDVRARLGGMKVAPVRADMIANEAQSPELNRDVVMPVTTVPKSATLGAKRAEAD